MSEPIGVRYAVEMRDHTGRVWWMKSTRVAYRRIEFQAFPNVGKLYRKKGDASRAVRDWEQAAIGEANSRTVQWTFRVRTINLTLGDEA